MGTWRRKKRKNRMAMGENDFPPRNINSPDEMDSKPARPKNEVWERPKFTKSDEEESIDDPVEIVNVLINGLKAQGISAEKFCEIAGFHKNTISKWKRGAINGGNNPPHWIGFLFKPLIIQMRAGAKMKLLLEEIENYKV